MSVETPSNALAMTAQPAPRVARGIVQGARPSIDGRGKEGLGKEGPPGEAHAPERPALTRTDDSAPSESAWANKLV